MKVFGSISRLVSILFRKDSNDVTLRPNQSTTYTAARDFQLPAGDSSQVLASASSVSTFTNKTFDADGSGNSITNIENADIKAGAAIDASKLADGSVSNAEFQFINSLTSNAQTQLNDKLNLSGGTMTGSINMGNNSITSLAAPSAAGDAATKSYVDAAINGLSWKQPVRVATTTAGTLASSFENGDTVDGVTLATGNRILIKDQAAGEENGIYTVNASGAPTRATDMDSLSPLDEVNGAAVFVLLGTANADKAFTQTATVSTLGTDPLVFSQFSSSGAVTEGNGIDITANVVSVDHDGQGLQFSGVQLALELDGSTLSKSASGVKVADGGISNTQVNASAAIDYSKLAALTASRALQSNGSGFVSASSVTNTELGYVSGVTSAIQTQINSKMTGSQFAATWTTGDGTSKTVTHSLGSKDVVVQVYDQTNDQTIEVDTVIRTDTNTVTLTSSEAPGGASWRVLIIKLG